MGVPHEDRLLHAVLNVEGLEYFILALGLGQEVDVRLVGGPLVAEKAAIEGEHPARDRSDVVNYLMTLMASVSWIC